MYHLSIKSISRSEGRTATAAAAYRAGAEITDLRTGELHSYKRKRDVVRELSGIEVPPGAPGWPRIGQRSGTRPRPPRNARTRASPATTR